MSPPEREPISMAELTEFLSDLQKIRKLIRNNLDNLNLFDYCGSPILPWLSHTAKRNGVPESIVLQILEGFKVRFDIEPGVTIEVTGK